MCKKELLIGLGLGVAAGCAIAYAMSSNQGKKMRNEVSGLLAEWEKDLLAKATDLKMKAERAGATMAEKVETEAEMLKDRLRGTGT